MIRGSTRADCNAMVRMGAAFRETFLPDFPFSPVHASRSFVAALGNPEAACFTLDIGGPVGVLAVELAKFPLGPAVLAKEVMFWIDPGHRGKWWRPMIATAEDWAASRGASFVAMSCFNDERTQKIFRRAGYSAREIVSTKRL